MNNIIVQEKIRTKIVEIRSQRVILDRDLAELYGVETKRLNEQVKRNIERFPGDFMFQLTKEEFNNLIFQNRIASSRSQVATLNDSKNLKSQIATSRRGENIKYLPYAFTEQGVAMLSSVLRSKQAIDINIAIMRVFVMVARIIDSSKTLAEKIEDITKEQKIYKKKTKKYGKNIKEIFSIINYLADRKKEDDESRQEIGFKSE